MRTKNLIPTALLFVTLLIFSVGCSGVSGTLKIESNNEKPRSCASITSELRDIYVNSPEFKKSDIRVFCTGGNVMLKGSANTPGIATKAGRLASRTDGVLGVTNEIIFEKGKRWKPQR